MDDQISRLVDKAWKKFLETPKEKRLLIAIAGMPGSGKTTLSVAVTTALNKHHAALHPSSPPITAFVPMDGFHYSRAQLNKFSNPTEAHARRGAEFTFDGQRFLELVQKLREPLTPNHPTVPAPSFDHKVKDPEEDAIKVERTHRIVVFEGNYVLLDKEPWKTAATLMDLRWFVEVDREVARERLANRHVAAGIVASIEKGEERAVMNDLPNGDQVVKNKVNGIDDVVTSVQDKGWVHL